MLEGLCLTLRYVQTTSCASTVNYLCVANPQMCALNIVLLFLHVWFSSCVIKQQLRVSLAEKEKQLEKELNANKLLSQRLVCSNSICHDCF